MTTPTTAHGTRRDRGGQTFVEFTRTFRAPIEDVWAAVTEPERLARWIGTWNGDPATGEVQFQMLYEGDDTPAERFTIDECEPPQLLDITSTAPSENGEAQTWQLHLALAEADGITTLTFAQNVPDPKLAEGVGPGWHYYLDRLVAAETGLDPAALEWDDYYPALTGHYRAEFA